MQTQLLCLALITAAAPPALAQNWFQGFANYPEKLNAQFISFGDFDLDGDVDVVAKRGPELQLWEQTGPGAQLTLGAVTALDPDTRLSGFAVQAIDMDGDGILDVTAWRSEIGGFNGFVLLRGQGDGTFVEQTATADGILFGLTCGDFNGDGNDDTAALLNVAGGVGRRVVMFEFASGGPRVFADVAGVTGSTIAAADMDGDGFEDAVVGSQNELQLVLGGASPQLGPVVATDLPISFGPALVGADFDGDGVGDLVAVTNGPAGADVQLFRGRAGQTALKLAATLMPGGLDSLPRAADWDGDGDLDLISNTLIFAPELRLAENLGDGQFSSSIAIAGGVNGILPAVGDLDGDGRQDVLLPRSVLFGNGAFERPWPAPGSIVSNQRFIDREGDGDADRFFGTSSFGLAVGLNDATGAFPETLLAPPTPAGFRYGSTVILGDFTGDGRLDFVSRYETAPPTPFEPPVFQEMRLLADDGLGGYVDLGAAAAPGLDLPQTDPMNPFGFGAARLDSVDLDLDGDLDLIGDRLFYENAGTAAAPDFLAGIELWSFPVRALGDIDGDGDTDLITFEDGISTPDRLRLERNLGGLNFSSMVFLANNRLETVPQLLDLDADGDLDLAIVLDTGPARIQLVENPGAGLVPKVQIINPLIGVVDAFGVDDVNGDGRLDLLAYRSSAPSSDYSLAALLGTDAPFQFEGLSTWTAGSIAGLVDADQDGDLDAINSSGAVLGRRFDRPDSGLIRQYGAGSPGAGGAVPVLGATGPWRVGSTDASLRVVLGNGGAPAFLAIAPAEALLVDFPFAGLTTLVSPGLINLLEFGLTPGAPGQGELTLPVPLANPAFAGIHRFHQVFLVDPSSPSLLSASNGLELLISN